VDHGDIEEHQPFLARDREHGWLEQKPRSNNKQYENNYEDGQDLENTPDHKS
ncbi:MAG: hypothetical protein HY268_03935, partial [Deltaproteobacteria bacterium]|nr:hypothetical protein [Deltaproteobacteria bacterium]